MLYTGFYKSPLGGITMASDGTALTGLWFDGHKYFARVRHVPMSSGTELAITAEDEIDVMYGKWDVPVTGEGLLSCIEEFVRRKEKRT